jgi:hypothetical protein
MKRLISLLSVALLGGLTVLAFGQWQVQPQIDPRVGPIYPVNPSYNFYSNQNNDPFQFNWASGRWDYVPFPEGSSSERPYQYSPPPYRPYENGIGPYVFGTPPASPTPPSGNSRGAISNAVSPNHPAPSPDDTQFWSTPSTQPEKAAAPQIVKFEGRIMGIKAVSLEGEFSPHLLIRLKNKAGATGTIDAGQCLKFPDNAFDPAVKGYITVTGQLGMLDGHLLLFADQIAFGSQTVVIERRGGNAPK